MLLLIGITTSYSTVKHLDSSCFYSHLSLMDWIEETSQIFQPGLIQICVLFCKTVFTYLTARFTTVSKIKCTLSGAKTLVQYVNTGMFLLGWYRYVLLFLLGWYRYVLLCFYYFDMGMYCCVCIKLFQVHIAAVQNSDIRGPSLN